MTRGHRFTITSTGGLTITPQGGLVLAPTRVTVGVGVRPLPFLPPHITLFADSEQDSSTSNNQVIPGNTYETPTGKKWSVNPDKKVEQMRVRGWTVEEINMVLDNPADSAGARAKNATATVYYRQDGHYIVVDDNTGNIMQFSDLHDSNWLDTTQGHPGVPIRTRP